MDALKKNIASAPLHGARSLARHQPGKRRCSCQSREKRWPRKRPRKSPRQSSTRPPSRHQAGHSGRCRRSSRTRLRSRPLLPSGRRRAEDPRGNEKGALACVRISPVLHPAVLLASANGAAFEQNRPRPSLDRPEGGPLFRHHQQRNPSSQRGKTPSRRSAFQAGNTWEGFEIAGASAFPPCPRPLCTTTLGWGEAGLIDRIALRCT
jgi:hypothetical protein